MRSGSFLCRRTNVVGCIAIGLFVCAFSYISWGQEKERPKTEREVALQQLETMRVAVHGLREAKRLDAVELLEREIRAQEIILERRRGEEAEAIKRRAPQRGQVVELLTAAAKQWRELGDEKKAAAVGQLAEQLATREQRRDAPRAAREEPRGDERGDTERSAREEPRGEQRKDAERSAREEPRGEQRKDAPPSEREVAARQLEIMRSALPALREGERKDAVGLLERAIRARQLQLEGRRDAEARELIERAPSREQQAQILGMAAGLWREYGQGDKAEAVAQLARQLAAGDRAERRESEPQQRERAQAVQREREPAADRPQARGDLEARLTRIERQLAELTTVLESLRKELRSGGEKRE